MKWNIFKYQNFDVKLGLHGKWEYKKEINPAKYSIYWLKWERMTMQKSDFYPFCGLYTIKMKTKKRNNLLQLDAFISVRVIQYNINTTKTRVCIAINDIYKKKRSIIPLLSASKLWWLEMFQLIIDHNWRQGK